jgi:hypothetical protein
MRIKGSTILIVITISIVLTGSLSVIGLLQSTERVSTSGIIIQPPPPPPNPPTSPPPYVPPPPEPEIEIDIYCDIECTETAVDVEWGSIEVGDSVTETLYIKNNGDYAVTLSLNTQNWNPTGATEYIHLSWDNDGSSLGSGEVREVNLTLTIDSDINGVDEFSFDIVLVGEAA